MSLVVLWIECPWNTQGRKKQKISWWLQKRKKQEFVNLRDALATENMLGIWETRDGQDKPFQSFFFLFSVFKFGDNGNYTACHCLCYHSNYQPHPLCFLLYFLSQELSKQFLYFSYMSACASVYVYAPGGQNRVPPNMNTKLHTYRRASSVFFAVGHLSTSRDKVLGMSCWSQIPYVTEDGIGLLISLPPTSQVPRLQVYSPFSVIYGHGDQTQSFLYTLECLLAFLLNLCQYLFLYKHSPHYRDQLWETSAGASGIFSAEAHSPMSKMPLEQTIK